MLELQRSETKRETERTKQSDRSSSPSHARLTRATSLRSDPACQTTNRFLGLQ